MAPEVLGLVIVLICIVFFITEWLPMCVTGVLGCFLMVLFKVSSFKVLFGGFSSSIVMLMFSAMVVGIAMFETGAAQIIGRFIIKKSHGNEKMFLSFSCLLSGLLSMFMANTALVGIFIPIIDSVCRTTAAMKRRNLMLPITYAIMFGGSSTLVGCTPQLTASGVMQSLTGKGMGMWDLTPPGLCLFGVFLIYMLTIGYKRNEGIWGGKPEVDMHVSDAKLAAVTKEKVNPKLPVMVAILVFMIVSYVLPYLPVTMTAMAAALLCVITGCCDVYAIVFEMQWQTVIFLACCLGIADGLVDSGASDLISAFVSGVLGSDTSAFAVFAVLVFMTLLVSQLITNSTALIITLPIALSICSQNGFNSLPYCVGITLAASIACCTPMAAAQIAMTQVAGYDFSDYLKASWPPTVIGYISILVFVPLFYPLS